MKRMPDFIDGRKSEDDFTRELDQAIRKEKRGVVVSFYRIRRFFIKQRCWSFNFCHGILVSVKSIDKDSFFIYHNSCFIV